MCLADHRTRCFYEYPIGVIWKVEQDGEKGTRSVRTRYWTLLLTSLLAFGSIMPVAAQRPNPHDWGTGTPSATAVATATPSGCALVKPYVESLYAIIDDSGKFAEFFYSDADFGDISAADAKQIISDGDVMITRLGELDVPPPYVEAHKNIVLFLQVNIDMARFYGIDSSVVPNIAAYDGALVKIEEGERALIAACPDEMKAVGGYILVNPEENQKPVDPESIPE